MPEINLLLKPDTWCVIPTYNNQGTIKKVAVACRQYLQNILVVDDGSVGQDIQELLAGSDIQVLKHPKNLGKGQAIRTALKFLQSRGAKFMLTIDADGQHFPQEIPKFIRASEDNPSAIIIGCRDFKQKNVPGKSQFGRSFSNFWVRLETGALIRDTQSGYRCYPVEYIAQIKTSGNYYDFETEILTRAVWAGLKIVEIPINVFYPPAALRVSSFHPLADNLRISLMHIRLLGRRLTPLPYPKVTARPKAALNILLQPVNLLKNLLSENATPLGLAISAGVGIFLGVLPLISLHMLSILYVTSRLHLNKVMALSIQNLCMPPFVPLACIELGHFMLYGKWLTNPSWENTFGALPERIWEWFLGSLILAPLLAAGVSLIIYLGAQTIQTRMLKHGRSS